MSPLDFGSPGRDRIPWLRITLVTLGVLGLATAVMKPRMDRDRADAIAEAQAWTILGPPCPRLSPAEAAHWPYQPRTDFDYAGANFGRVFGHVACAEIHADGGRSLFRGYPVCQFTSPAVVAVDAGGGRRAFFAPGLGQPATVSVRDGLAWCVMAAKFKGQNDF